MIRPEIVKDEHLEFLDEWRESGDINMFGCRPYVAKHFDLNHTESSEIVSYWMKSFGETDR